MNRNGTCYSATECSDKGGKASGNCASGFGVCCLFVLSSTSKLTVKENNTYIQNPSFPSVYSETSALSYTINKCEDSKLNIYLVELFNLVRNYTLSCKIHLMILISTDICAVRLDFETFVTLGPLSNQEGGDPVTLAGHTTHACADKLTASVVFLISFDSTYNLQFDLVETQGVRF